MQSKFTYIFRYAARRHSCSSQAARNEFNSLRNAFPVEIVELQGGDRGLNGYFMQTILKLIFLRRFNGITGDKPDRGKKNLTK